MTVAVFGGTGRTGRLVVAKALAAGHKVRVLARDPDKIAPAFGLEFIKGDVLDGGRVMATMTGCEAAVVVLGSVKSGPVDVCSRGTDLVLQAAAKAGARKVVAVTSLGVGDSRNDVPWIFRLVADLFLKKVMEDKQTQETLVRASELDWTIVRPTGLTDGPETGSALMGTGPMASVVSPGRVPKGQISRADVADFVIKTLADRTYTRSTWFISN